MFYIENDKKLNYGFESFSPLSEMTTVKSKMVEYVSMSGFTRKWNGSTCYGNDEYSSSTSGSVFKFKVKKKFNYMKISYKDGISGNFKLLANNNLLASITTTTGTETAKMSESINISSYDENQIYELQLINGSMTISGIELGYDTSYTTFNNYGRAGIGANGVSGELLNKECDADLIIYALGTNSIDQTTVTNVTNVLKNKNCVKVILDLGIKSTKYNKLAISNYLKQIADNVNGIYIKINDYIPKDSNGYIDPSYVITDGLHPSELGHKCIAEYIAKTIGLSVTSKGLTDYLFTEW